MNGIFSSRVARTGLLSLVGLALALVPATRFTPTADAQIATTINVCGTLNSYTPASLLLPGVLRLGGIPYLIGPGSTVNGAGSATVGNTYCLSASVNALGAITAGTLTPQAAIGAAINVCGTVNAYAAASATTAGALNLGGTTYPVAAGAALANSSLLTPGADVCISGNLNAAGQISNGTVTANATGSVGVCGTVTNYTANTASAPGSVTLGGQTIPISAGASITGQNLLLVGANLCVKGTLNGSGQLSNGTVTANGSTMVNVCGVVSAYTAPTASSPGSVTIAGQTFPIAAGTALSGAGALRTGNNVCLAGTANATGQVDGGTVTLNGGGTVNVCGTVSGYAAATGSAPGSVTVGGQTVPIAAGATLAGAGLLTSGANVCLAGTLDASGQLSNGTVTANGATSVSVCGTVTAYTASTTSFPGSITINGQTFPIAAGTTLIGGSLLTAGANPNVCLYATLNGSGQISGGTVSANAAATTAVNVCGTVSAYTAATATAPGSITIGGQTFPIAAGTTLNGSGLITSGANLCLSGTANGAGQITNGTVTANAGATVNVCGTVSSYTAATATAPGSITIGGQTFPIAAGTTLNGAGLISNGASLCLSGTANASGQISNGTVTANAGGSVNVCGAVTSYTAATATAPGSITLGGQTFPIAAGTTLANSGLIQIGANLCLGGTLNASGQISSGGVSANVGASVHLCGLVGAYTAATSSAPGSVTIGGQTVPIAAGTSLSGAGLLTSGANVCLDGSANASGQVTGGSVSAQASATAKVCGSVTNYTAATGSAPGSIAIGGQTFPIAPGATLSGANTLTAGTNACLLAILDAHGQVTSGSVTPSVGASATVCGTVSAYTAASSTTPGSLGIGGITLPLAPGAVLSGSAPVATGSNLCVAVSIGSSGQVSAGTITLNTLGAGGATTVSGPTGSIVLPAAGSGGGTIYIGGYPFSVAPGTNVNVTGPAPLSAVAVAIAPPAGSSRWDFAL